MNIASSIANLKRSDGYHGFLICYEKPNLIQLFLDDRIAVTAQASDDNMVILNIDCAMIEQLRLSNNNRLDAHPQAAIQEHASQSEIPHENTVAQTKNEESDALKSTQSAIRSELGPVDSYRAGGSDEDSHSDEIFSFLPPREASIRHKNLTGQDFIDYFAKSNQLDRPFIIFDELSRSKSSLSSILYVAATRLRTH